jgi:hypothetical protein
MLHAGPTAYEKQRRTLEARPRATLADRPSLDHTPSGNRSEFTEQPLVPIQKAPWRGCAKVA